MAERVQRAPVKSSPNGNLCIFQYMEECGARIAMVSPSLTLGRRHFSGIWLTVQLAVQHPSMPGHVRTANLPVSSVTSRLTPPYVIHTTL